MRMIFVSKWGNSDEVNKPKLSFFKAFGRKNPETEKKKFWVLGVFYISRRETYVSRRETYVSRREIYVSRRET